MCTEQCRKGPSSLALPSAERTDQAVDHEEQTTRRTRGRPESFDRRAVVADAVRAFWAGGHDGTSLDAIERATGVDRSTLYNSFGGKSGLYRSAAAAYVDQVVDHLCAGLVDGTATDLGDVLTFLDLLEQAVTSEEHPPGCLIVNDLTDDAHDRDATDRYLEVLRSGFRGALVRAGIHDQTRRAQRADALTALVVGANATARHDIGAARSMIEGARSTVREWAGEQAP